MVIGIALSPMLFLFCEACMDADAETLLFLFVDNNSLVSSERERQHINFCDFFVHTKECNKARIGARGKRFEIAMAHCRSFPGFQF